jgi:hypothetical protein
MTDTNVKFSKYITTRDGRRIYAEDYGLKAFPLYGLSEKKEKAEEKKETIHEG